MDQLSLMKYACARELLAQGAVTANQALDLAKYAEQAEEGRPNLRKYLIGTAGETAARASGLAGAHAMTRQSGKYMESNPARAQELLGKLKAKSPVPIQDVEGLDNSMFVPGPFSAKQISKKVGVPVQGNSILMGSGANSPHVLAHELGHADIAGSRWGKLLQNTPTTLLGNASQHIGAASGLLTGLNSDEGSKARKWGIAAPALAAAPQLMYEAGATALGMRKLRGAGASGKELLHSLKTLGPAYGTYLSRAGGGVASAAAMQGVGGAIRDHRKKKTAGVTPERARRSLDRLDTLESNKPTVGQAGRYGAIGGVGGAGIGAIGNMIEHGSALKGATPKAKALNFAANAAKGALGGGAIPLLRNTMDRRAEVGTLHKFVRENRGIPNA